MRPDTLLPIHLDCEIPERLANLDLRKLSQIPIIEITAPETQLINPMMALEIQRPIIQIRSQSASMRPILRRYNSYTLPLPHRIYTAIPYIMTRRPHIPELQIPAPRLRARSAELKLNLPLFIRLRMLCPDRPPLIRRPRRRQYHAVAVQLGRVVLAGDFPTSDVAVVF